MTSMHEEIANAEHRESGFTLVEMIISIVLLALIGSGIVAVLGTSLNTTQPASERVRESVEAQTIAAFLTRDAQAAGGTNPATASLDTTIGVAIADATGCVTAGQPLLHFAWNDRSGPESPTQQPPAPVLHVVNYSYLADASALQRTVCIGTGSAQPQTLATHVASVVPSCDPSACPRMPSTVSLTVTALNKPLNLATAYHYTVTASLRPQSQTPPPNGASPFVPLFVTGTGGGCIHGATGIDESGSPSTLRVYGGVVLNAPDAACGPAVAGNGHPSFLSGRVFLGPDSTCGSCIWTTAAGNSFVDPFMSLKVPDHSCTSGTNPPSTIVGGKVHYQPGEYDAPNPFQAATNAVFEPVTTANPAYVFCNGVTFSSSNTGSGVVVYVPSGTVSGDPKGLTPPTSGPYVGLLIWQDRANATDLGIRTSGSEFVAGTVYAPAANLDMNGQDALSVRVLIVGKIWLHGNPNLTIGAPPGSDQILTITNPTSLPNATIGRPYPTTEFRATGGSNAYHWVASGLPPGITLDDSTGVLSGTPTVTGSFSVTVNALDILGNLSNDTSYSFTVNPVPNVTGPATMKNWTLGRTYPAIPMTASGGTTPFTWTQSGLPAGLTINNSTGVISGVPTVSGTSNVTVTLTDARGAQATKSYNNVVINAAPVVTGPATLPDWTQNVAYQAQTMTASNGTSPLSWAASGLPSGLSINSSTGTISGTPGVPGAYAPDITVTDAAGASATLSYTLTINGPPSIGTVPPNGEQGKPYSYRLVNGGGTPPFTFSITAGALPTGLTLNASTGVISGTPTTLGSPSVTIRVRDKTGATGNRSFNLTIVGAPTITGPPNLQAWTVDRNYPDTPIAATGGVTPYDWAASGLPAGMTMNAGTGVLTGKPTVSCTCSVTVALTDLWGGTASQTYALTVNLAPTIATSSLPDGEQTVSYTATASAMLGTTPYAWSANGLPAGLSISTTGQISGTPTTFGTFPVVVTATDAAGASASRSLSLVILAPPTNALGLSDQSGGGSILSGTTVYYRGSVAGAFTITNAAISSASPVSSAFLNLTGTTTGFSHAGGTVSTPPGGPFVSSPFSWAANTSSSPKEVVTTTDSMGGSASTTLTFVSDRTAPTVAINTPATSTNSVSPTISGTAGAQAEDATYSADAGSVTVQIFAGTTTTGSPLETFSPSVAAGAWSANASALAANSQYTLKVTQSDEVGNTGTAARTFTVDNVAPSVTAAMANAGGNSKITVSGTAGATGGDASSVTIYLCTNAQYTGHGNTCDASTSPTQTLTPPVNSGSYSATSGNNGTGVWWATVTQSDAAGNIGAITIGPFTR